MRVDRNATVPPHRRLTIPSGGFTSSKPHLSPPPLKATEPYREKSTGRDDFRVSETPEPQNLWCPSVEQEQHSMDAEMIAIFGGDSDDSSDESDCILVRRCRPSPVDLSPSPSPSFQPELPTSTASVPPDCQLSPPLPRQPAEQGNPAPPMLPQTGDLFESAHLFQATVESSARATGWRAVTGHRTLRSAVRTQQHAYLQMRCAQSKSEVSCEFSISVIEQLDGQW